MTLAKNFMPLVIILFCGTTIIAAPGILEDIRASANRPDEVIAVDAPFTLTPARDDFYYDTLFYEYGFEEGWDEWTREALNDDDRYWHPSEEHAFEEGSSWWCSDEDMHGYNNHWMQHLTTPLIDLSDLEGIRLRFVLFHGIEDTSDSSPGAQGYPEYTGWDGANVWISIDDGLSWEVLLPQEPEYTYESLFSFGSEWGMGPGVPGWASYSKEWLEAEFNLDDYAGEEVRIRWTFCSDPAWCTTDDADAYGFLVDEMEVVAGDSAIWSNDGEEQGNMELSTGQAELWAITDHDAHEGDFCAHCRTMVTVDNALVSPPLDIPEAPWDHSSFDFWVRCDTHTPYPNGDYFRVEVSTDGEEWEEIVHEHGRNDEWRENWQYFGPNTTNNQNIPDWKRELDLSQFTGQTVWLRWRFLGDANMNEPQGEGLFIDDFRLLGLKRRTFINVPEDAETIQGAIAQAGEGDTILVQPGLYVDNLDFQGKTLVVGSLFFTTGDPAYIDSTVIDGNRDGRVVSLENEEGEGTALIGFTLIGGNVSMGGGIYCRGSSPLVSHCVISNNTVNSYGGGIYSHGGATPTFINCIISGNRAVRSGGGIYLRTSAPTFINCSITGNSADQEGGGFYCRTAELTIVNSILWNDTPQEMVFSDLSDPSVVTISYSDVQGGEEGIVTNDNGEVIWGDGNIDEDPLFENADEGDFSLTAESPCIDAGDPQSDPDPDDTRADMGTLPFDHGERDIAVEPDRLDFGVIEPGNSAELTVEITNIDEGTLRVYSQTIIPEETPFDITEGGEPFYLALDDIHTTTVTFNPLDEDDFIATLRIVSNDLDEDTVDIELTGGASGVGSDREVLPREFALLPVYPNPFNNVATVQYALPTPRTVSLKLYDLDGRETATLFSGLAAAGYHQAILNGEGLTSGVYIVRLEASGEVRMQKVILIR